MTSLRFDIDSLMDRLGDKRARRAQNYFNNGWVRVIAIEDGRALAIVTGETGKLYNTEVRDDGEGECTCPDFPLERTCKHIGATALAADALGPRDARALDGRLSVLRDTLAGEPRELLVARLMDLARSLPGAIEVIDGPSEQT
jgi:uncharacterized Zn finger protein